MGAKLDNALAILNGLVGDHLAKTGNGLVTEAAFHHEGHVLRLDRASLEAAFPKATPRIVVLVHGLMVTESVWAFPDGGDVESGQERDAEESSATAAPMPSVVGTRR